MVDHYFKSGPLLDAIQQLETIKLYMEEDPQYLDREECPYPEDLKKWLRTPVPIQEESEVVGNVTVDELQKETIRLFNDLKTFGTDVQSAEPSVRAAFFRVSVALTERMIALQERASGLAEYGNFKAFVLRIIEDELTPDQRSHIMDRLKEYANE